MSFSRVRIFNPLGYLIDEIQTATVRSWVLNSQTTVQGRCDFSVPIYGQDGYNPKTAFNNFKPNNLVLIEHQPTTNADDTQNGLLPPWVGVISPLQNWEYGKLSITVDSAEKILSYRPLGYWFYASAPAGGIVADILRFANGWPNLYGPGIQIFPGNIDTSSKHIKYELKVDSLSEIQTLSKLSGYDWELVPQLASGNRLQLYLNWVPVKGIAPGVVISNKNMQNSSPILTQQGEFYNVLLAYSTSWTQDNRVEATSVDQDSINQYGIRPHKEVFPNTDGASKDVMQALADAWLAQHKKPQQIFAPTLIDEGNLFSYCSCGNIFMVQNNTVGFQNGGIGLNGLLRVTAIEYDDIKNTCDIAGVFQS